MTTYPQVQLLRELGRGGFAIVHEGVWDAKKVAVKEFISKTDHQIQQKEASIHARLIHPNVLPLLAVHSDDPQDVKIIMELADSGCLAEWISTGRLGRNASWARIVQCGVQLFRGLEYVHGNLILHGDIKPENILVHGENCDLWLGDFGLAMEFPTKGKFQLGRKTSAGTAQYQPQEQLTGPKRASPKSDVFSMALVLWEVVQGVKSWSWEVKPKGMPLRLTQMVQALLS